MRWTCAECAPNASGKRALLPTSGACSQPWGSILVQAKILSTLSLQLISHYITAKIFHFTHSLLCRVSFRKKRSENSETGRNTEKKKSGTALLTFSLTPVSLFVPTRERKATSEERAELLEDKTFLHIQGMTPNIVSKILSNSELHLNDRSPFDSLARKVVVQLTPYKSNTAYYLQLLPHSMFSYRLLNKSLIPSIVQNSGNLP